MTRARRRWPLRSLPRNCTSMAVRPTSTMQTAWRGQNCRGPRSNESYKSPAPDGTGTASSTCWKGPKKWTPSDQPQAGSLRLCQLTSAEPKDESGSNPNVVLAITQTVCEFRHVIFGLQHSNRHDLVQVIVQPSARSHGEMIC